MTNDSNLQPVGGFFELELPTGRTSMHRSAIALSTGRSCLCAILGFLRPQKCLLPYYICGSAIEPFKQFNVDVDFYDLTESLTPAGHLEIGPNDCLLYVNYFGIMRDEVERLARQYGRRLIVDNTHDFFFEGGYERSWSFTSARKHFGIPDGAFLDVPRDVDASTVVPPDTPPFRDVSIDHALQRLAGRQQQAFEQFRLYESRLPCELYRISDYSRCILSHVDVARARTIRRQNVRQLSQALNSLNSLRVPVSDEAVPYAYPFLPASPLDRKQFHDHGIYVPTLWPDLPAGNHSGFPVSCHLAQNLLPLPIDHRYGGRDMQRILDVVLTNGE